MKRLKEPHLHINLCWSELPGCKLGEIESSSPALHSAAVLVENRRGPRGLTTMVFLVISLSSSFHTVSHLETHRLAGELARRRPVADRHIQSL